MPTPRKNTTNEGGIRITGQPECEDTPAPVAVEDRIAEFEESGFGRLLGLHITEARDGYARVEMDCEGKCNPHGIAHGGAIFALADHAFGIASNCGNFHHTAVSVHIQYLAPAKGRLVAIAERVGRTGTCEMHRVTVYEGDRIIAIFDGVAFRVSS
jgi:acyl-CoA thioesterase